MKYLTLYAIILFSGMAMPLYAANAEQQLARDTFAFEYDRKDLENPLESSAIITRLSVEAERYCRRMARNTDGLPVSEHSYRQACMRLTQKKVLTRMAQQSPQFAAFLKDRAKAQKPRRLAAGRGS